MHYRNSNHPLINVSILNYSFVHVNSTSNAGGVAVHLHSYLKNKFYDQQFSLSNSECMWIKVCSPFSKFSIGVVYRYPIVATVDNFFDEFSSVSDVLPTGNELYYILRDFNINITQNQASGISKKFLHTLISNGAIPLNTKATRVTDRVTPLNNNRRYYNQRHQK